MVDVSELRVAVGLAASDASKDALLVTLRDRATALLGRSLNRFLGVPATKEEVRSGGCSCAATGLSSLYLYDDPWTGTGAGATILQTRTRAGDDWTTVDTADYELLGRLLTLKSGTFSSGPATVRILYSVGYATGEGPEELQALVVGIVAAWYARHGKDPSLQSESLGDYSYTRFGAEDYGAVPGLRGAIDRWRRRLV